MLTGDCFINVGISAAAAPPGVLWVCPGHDDDDDDDEDDIALAAAAAAGGPVGGPGPGLDWLNHAAAADVDDDVSTGADSCRSNWCGWATTEIVPAPRHTERHIDRQTDTHTHTVDQTERQSSDILVNHTAHSMISYWHDTVICFLMAHQHIKRRCSVPLKFWVKTIC